MKLPTKFQLSLAALGLFACGSPPAPAAGHQLPSPDAVLAGSALSDEGWGVLRSKALGVKLALPQSKAWSEPPGASPDGAAWQLLHTTSGTRLTLRRWRASRLPHVDVCDTELRQRTPGLAVPDETNLVAQREVRVPQGFVTRITLLALPAGNDSAAHHPQFRGQAVAVGAGIGECLAAVAVTETPSEPELAERLRLFDVALGHLRLTHVEDRVPPARHPSL